MEGWRTCVKAVIKQTKKQIHTVAGIYELIKSQIWKWELLPGQKIEEKEMAQHLHVSRYLVRRALLRLCAHSLVEVRPGQGSFVAQLDLEKDDDLRFMRASMESALLRESIEEDRFFPTHIKLLEDCIQQQREAIACKDFHLFCKYDENFHMLLIDVNGRQYAKSNIQQAMWYLARIRYIAIQMDDHPQDIVQEHEKLLDAIIQSNVPAAEQAMKDHIYKGYHTFLAGQGFEFLKPYIKSKTTSF